MSKLSLTDISRAMAKASGREPEVCEQFIRALFAVVGAALVSGENVKVKGIGTFKVTDVDARRSVNVNTGREMTIDSHRKVTFVPDKALAAAANIHFSMFVSEEIADGLDEKELEAVGTIPEVSDNVPPTLEAAHEELPEEDAPRCVPTCDAEEADAPTPETAVGTLRGASGSVPPTDESPEEELSEADAPQSEPTTEPEKADALRSVPTADTEEEDAPRCVPTSNAEPAQDELPEEEPQQDAGILDEPQPREPRSHFWRGLWVGVGTALVLVAAACIVVYFCLPDAFFNLKHPASEQIAAVVPAANPSPQPTTKPVAPTAADTAVPDVDLVPTQPSDQVEKTETAPKPDKFVKKYDVIGPKRYLTTMAKEYYGNYNLWPLIYDANPGLGHPDRIRPGTKIRIPSPKELGVNPSDAAVLSKAKQRGGEIYAKYK